LKNQLRHKLNLQLFAEGKEKTKLEKHLEELEENTSGGSKDAVTFAGKGLSILSNLFKSLNKKADPVEEDEVDDEEEEEEDVKPRKVKKNAKKANGGDYEESDEDIEDPADDDGNIIANKGKKISKDSLKSAVSKNDRSFDERRFAKSMDEHEDILDASPALKELSKAVRLMGKSMGSTNEQVEVVIEQNTALVKAVRELLKSNAALASDLELVKKQPVNAPATGYVVLNKQSAGGKEVRLSKSDIQDSLTDFVNDGLVDARLLRDLNSVRGDADLRNFVDNLPASVREKL
jgi:hypothetical protein